MTIFSEVDDDVSTTQDSGDNNSVVSAAESMESSEIDVTYSPGRIWAVENSRQEVREEEWEVENAQRDDICECIEADQRNELGERVRMWTNDSYDDQLTARQEPTISGPPGITNLEEKEKRIDSACLNNLLDVTVTLKNISSILIDPSCIKISQESVEANNKTNMEMLDRVGSDSDEEVPYIIRWRTGCRTGKMILAFDPKVKENDAKEGICHSIQTEYNPNLRLTPTPNRNGDRQYAHPAWDRDIDIIMDDIYLNFCTKLVKDVRVASSRITTRLSNIRKDSGIQESVEPDYVRQVVSWVESVMNTHNEPSIQAIIQSPGYIETWGATIFLLHERPVDSSRIRTRIEEGQELSTLSIFWEDYGWIGPFTDQQTKDVTSTLILYSPYVVINRRFGGDMRDHLMYRRICHRCGYSPQDPRIKSMFEEPEVEGYSEIQPRIRTMKAMASLSWIHAIPTSLGLRQMVQDGHIRKERRNTRDSVYGQLATHQNEDKGEPMEMIRPRSELCRSMPYPH